MSRARTVAVTRFTDKVSRRNQPKSRYASVESVTDANTVNVRLPKGGVPFQNVPNAFNLSAGATVELEVRGLAGSEKVTVARPVRLAPNQSSNNPNRVVETPEIAGFYHHMRTLQGGVVILVITIVVWQIADQWRDNKSVGYELEVRQVTENLPSHSLSIQPRGQMVASLASGIDDDDTTIPIAAIAAGLVEGLAPDSGNQFPPRFGYVDVENESIFYDTYELGSQFTGALRGQDNQQGTPTAAASHSSGALVRARSVSFSLEGLAGDTNHEFRVRAVLPRQYSNWSDWVLYKTPGVIPAETRTADLITNGTFNSNTTGWALDGVHAATLAHAPTIGFANLGSAYIEEDGAAFATGPEFEQTGISATPGYRYVLEGYVSVDGDIYAGDYFVWEMRFDVVDSTFSSVYVDGDQMGRLEDNKWSYFRAEGVAPYGATTLDIALTMQLTRGVGEQARIYVDDVRLTRYLNSKSALSEAAIETDSMRVGGGGAITKILHHSETWNPNSINAGDSELKTVTVSGAAAGDKALAGFSAIAGNDMELTATVIGTDTVLVRLVNWEVGSVDLGSGTLSVLVFGSGA